MSLPLEELAGRARPVALADQRVLPALGPLSAVLPAGGLRRGSTVTVSSDAHGPERAGGAAGATSLALALMAAPSQTGSWVAAVGSGATEIGLAAAAELGVALERFALVPDTGEHWATVVATLIDAMEIVLLTGREQVRQGEARRLMARARERGAVLVVLGSVWPERADLRLTVASSRWRGLGPGFGHLQARRVQVTAVGRGAATRPQQVELWLTDRRGEVALAAREEPAAGAAAGGPTRAMAV